MEAAIHEQSILIVGGGIAGLTTALGLHRGKFESQCVKRVDSLEILERELLQGTLRYSSKIVSIDESGNFTLVHLADGSIFRTKALIGCDGVKSIVAKWLGFQSPVSASRSVIRGFVLYPDGHGFEPKFYSYVGGRVRYGFIPCDDNDIYWFCTFSPSLFQYDGNKRDPLKMKQFVINRIGNTQKNVLDVVERTELDYISCAPLKFRSPWNILFRNIVKNNVYVAGDALHPMTPDLGQGACSAIEDAVVLARCLGGALISSTKDEESYENGEWVGEIRERGEMEKS